MARMTVKQAASLWGVSATTIREWVYNGRMQEGRDFYREDTPRGPIYWVTRREIPPHRPEAFLPIDRSGGKRVTSPSPPPPSPSDELRDEVVGDEAVTSRKGRRIIVR